MSEKQRSGLENSYSHMSRGMWQSSWPRQLSVFICYFMIEWVEAAKTQPTPTAHLSTPGDGHALSRQLSSSPVIPHYLHRKPSPKFARNPTFINYTAQVGTVPSAVQVEFLCNSVFWSWEQVTSFGKNTLQMFYFTYDMLPPWTISG